LFSSLTYGAGGALGAYVSGQIWMQDFGVTMFEWAAISALAGVLVVAVFVPAEKTDKAVH